MKQQNQQQYNEPNQQQHGLVQTAQSTHNPQTAGGAGTATFAGLAKTRIINKFGMTEQGWAIYDAEVSIGLLTLRTAFPTQSRNYSDREHDMLAALWLEIFVEVERGILHEAIMRFVSNDRKGFFPSPGQIMGIVEDMQAEREQLEKDERMREHVIERQAYYQRVESGENCSTCLSCECRAFVHPYDSQQNESRLFCQNPNSYKYEGNSGYGTSANIVCDFYEPKPLMEGLKGGDAIGKGN